MWTTGMIQSTRKEKDKLEIVLTVPATFERNICRCESRSVSLRLDDGRFISDQQRKKIYATFREISEFTGFTPNETKQVMKVEHIIRTGADYLSLENCTMTQAKEFLNTLIDFCLEYGIPMNDTLAERSEDIDHSLWMCLKYKKCAICGRPGEVHHWDAIGMGNDRRTVDDRWHRKICLCREHHTKAHGIGGKRFMAMYHVYGIFYQEGKEEQENGNEAE